MADFLKMGMNRQNLAIEKSLQTDQVSSDATWQVVTVARNEGYPTDTGTEPPGTTENDGTITVQLGSHAVPADIADFAAFTADINAYYIEEGTLIVEGKNNTWTEYTFLVF